MSINFIYISRHALPFEEISDEYNILILQLLPIANPSWNLMKVRHEVDTHLYQDILVILVVSHEQFNTHSLLSATKPHHHDHLTTIKYTPINPQTTTLHS
ncbi:hypothetical protein L1987_14674 [Smallanthus sonchifolius]|uniref:Uncharacterized protein n=1 Tax=Smallanthus sonchifolius TaxID=185202 RepID=A0ACB9J510_9ASTR|nr:hypothetical protein L1987_14674 [Smallanthus sonchifolius]